MSKILLSLIILTFSHSAFAVCEEGKRICVDGPGSKFINGVEVFRECWNYQTEMRCSENETIDYCKGLSTLKQCAKESSVCTSFGLNGECLGTLSTYRCSAPADNIEGAILIDYSHTVNSGSDTSSCANFLDNPQCFIAKEECVEGPGTRFINGVAVYKECWKKEYSYACAAQGVSNSCAQLQAAGCKPVGDSVCIKEGANGCTQFQQTYQCADTPPIAGDDITSVGGTQNPGFDMLSCTHATAGMTCSAPKSLCLKEGPDGACLQLQYTYDCVKNVSDNRCEVLEKLPECEVRSSVCEERNGLSCIAYKKEIFCKGDKEIDAPGADIIDSNISIGSISQSDTCKPLEENPNCAILRTECTEPGGEKIVNGVPIYKDCWKYEHTYVCGALSGTQSDCDKLEMNSSCVKVSSDCIAVDDSGKCLTTAHTYRCEEKEGSVTTETVCRPAECLNGLCDGANDPADTDFSKVLSYLEIVRQASVYGDIENGLFFNGQKDKCTKKVLGFSCCDTKVKAGTSNSSAFGKAMSFTGETTVEAIKYIGSPYVYDVLSASSATEGMLNFLYGNAASGVYNPSLSFYGFGMTLQGGTMYFTFDPYSFAISVAFQIAMDYLQCEQSEQTLMLKKGQNLCHYVGTYCSKGEKFGCIERSESYCCYNSPLARILQEQGRIQLGKSWGSAKDPVCTGFTMEELESLDFDKMDLSEFEALIVTKNGLDDAAAKDRGETHLDNLISKDLGAYVSPSVGTSAVVDPNFTGKPQLPAKKRNLKQPKP
ncbi:conjugal transfer protein TraN [uncultured Parasutterella sp.]|uniref:conjugal transfer protein TraN n=1 Tax=uncultured Parasutterella sp. TaxID=1263098 RepID=UPI00272C83A7|nr:conjugal transfer protein TraN [uncultured Parasutterella sp.]